MLATFQNLFFVALGGAVGAALRYGIYVAASFVPGATSTTGTLAVNALGSLVIGILFAFSSRFTFDPRLLLFLFVGVIGSFTTFSTFALESLELYRNGLGRSAMIYIVGTNLLCLAAVFVGYTAGRWASDSVS